jgi:tetratricopeptide (TPR) repeat protein
MRLPQTLAAVVVLAIVVPAAVVATRAARDRASAEGAPGASSTTTPSARPARPPPESKKQTYADLLAEYDRSIKTLRRRCDQFPKEWLSFSKLASAQLQRASLTAQIDDLEAVQKTLEQALALQPGLAGPLDVAARYNFSIHRLEAAEAFLDRQEKRKIPQKGEATAIALLRAQIALQRGDYQAAFDGLGNVAAGDPEAAAAELALYHAWTGEPDQAESLLQEALEATPPREPRRRAWLRLQLAQLTMDRGKYRDALQRLEQADAELPGWWQVHEKMGEAYGALGEKDRAITAFKYALELNELPQLMDALAGAYEHAGRKDEAKPLIEKAAALWKDHMKRLPEAAMGHGLYHELQFGTPERSLELARANVALRPGGEAQILLARALLKAGQAEEALAVAQRTLKTRFRSAALHDVAAKAHAALGHTTEADAERERCFALNPFYQDTLHSH